MIDYEPSGQESTDNEQTKTERRAEWEGFEFRVPTPGAVRVENVSYGEESDEHVYVVSVEGGIPFDCTCPAWQYHSPDDGCKHMVAVENTPAVTLAASNAPPNRVATDGGEEPTTRCNECSNEWNEDEHGHECPECGAHGHPRRSEPADFGGGEGGMDEL